MFGFFASKRDLKRDINRFVKNNFDIFPTNINELFDSIIFNNVEEQI